MTTTLPRAAKHLTGKLEVKARDEEARTFEAALSTSHLDLGDGLARDIVHPGAFRRTIDHFRAAKDPYIPLLDSHDPFSVMNVLGHMLDAEEHLTGETLSYTLRDGSELEVAEMALWTKWKVIEGGDGDRILDRLRSGAVRAMSMGYDIAGEVDTDALADGTPVRHLREVKLMEGSLVVWGMNPHAQVDLETVKGLLRTAEKRPLSEGERKLLEELQEKISALLTDPSSDAGKGQAPDTETDGLAPDDPRRLKLEHAIRDLELRSLAG